METRPSNLSQAPSEMLTSARQAYAVLNINFLKSMLERSQTMNPKERDRLIKELDECERKIKTTENLKEATKNLSDVREVAIKIFDNSALCEEHKIDFEKYDTTFSQYSPRSADTLNQLTIKMIDFNRWTASKLHTIAPVPAPVALLDVDGTLVFGSKEGKGGVGHQSRPREGTATETSAEAKTLYNTTLIEALKKKGVTDAYLFSSMSIDNDALKDRGELIVWLGKQGINVQGVITDNDPGVAIECDLRERLKIPSDEEGGFKTEEERDTAMTNVLERKRRGEMTIKDNALLGKVSKFKEDYKDKPCNFACGRVYEEAARANELPANQKSINNLDGGITAALSEGRQNYDSDEAKKALMYEMFMSSVTSGSLPSYNAVIYADDAKNCLSGAEKAHANFFSGSGVSLVTINVDKNKITSENKLESKEVYLKELKELGMTPKKVGLGAKFSSLFFRPAKETKLSQLTQSSELKKGKEEVPDIISNAPLTQPSKPKKSKKERDSEIHHILQQLHELVLNPPGSETLKESRQEWFKNAGRWAYGSTSDKDALCLSYISSLALGKKSYDTNDWEKIEGIINNFIKIINNCNEVEKQEAARSTRQQPSPEPIPTNIYRGLIEQLKAAAKDLAPPSKEIGLTLKKPGH